jgi:hypothetical protein
LSLAKVQSLFGPLMLALIELVIWSWSTLVAWCILKVQSKVSVQLLNLFCT